jgi:hypothetical protein
MATANALLDALGKQLGSALQLENGVCALFEGDREVAIIEIPASGDVAMLHCKLPLRPDTGVHERLLRLNFDTAAMHGCWLALDGRSEVRLCAQAPLEWLSETGFVHWVQGFVQQTQDIPALLRMPRSGPVKSTVPRPHAAVSARPLIG